MQLTTSRRGWAGVGLVSAAAIAAALLTPSAAFADTPLNGQVTYNGTGVAGVLPEFFQLSPTEGTWDEVDEADAPTDGAGNWAYTGTLDDGTYALYYDTSASNAGYASDQAAGGVTDTTKLVGQFTVTGGVASTATIPSTPLTINAGAVVVTVTDGITGATLSAPAVTSARAAVSDGYDSTGSPLGGTSSPSTGTFNGTVAVIGVVPGTYYDVYSSGVGGYDSSDTFPAAGVPVVLGQTTTVTTAVFPSGTPSARELVGTPRVVTVTGVPKVGTLLTAMIPASGAAVSYQWLSSDRTIPGATAPTYVPTASDLGSTLYVRATLTALGHETDYLYSATTKAVQVGDPNVATVKVTGTKKIAHSLTAAVTGGTVTEAKAIYQWYRNGAPISGAVGSKYLLAKADVGQKVFASVTSFAQGHTDAVIPSNIVSIAHDKATLAYSAKKSISKSTKLKVKVNLKDGASNNSATGTVRVYYSTKKFKKLSFTSKSTTKTATLPKLSKGKHTIKIKYYGDTHYLTKSTSFTVTVK